jgi:hypothetical protein
VCWKIFTECVVGGYRARRWMPTQHSPDASPSSEGVTAEGPLGDERNVVLLSLPSLRKLLYITTKLLLFLLLQLPPYAMKEPKHLEPKAMKLNRSHRSSLLINVCLFSYKRTSIYRRPWGRIKQPNYTFSVPDKRLYTLLKGITVTPHFVRASSVSSHGRASFTRGTFCLSFVRRPLHVRCLHVAVLL